jgi:hypothetical protein
MQGGQLGGVCGTGMRRGFEARVEHSGARGVVLLDPGSDGWCLLRWSCGGLDLLDVGHPPHRRGVCPPLCPLLGDNSFHAVPSKTLGTLASCLETGGS